MKLPRQKIRFGGWGVRSSNSKHWIVPMQQGLRSRNTLQTHDTALYETCLLGKTSSISQLHHNRWYTKINQRSSRFGCKTRRIRFPAPEKILGIHNSNWNRPQKSIHQPWIWRTSGFRRTLGKYLKSLALWLWSKEAGRTFLYFVGLKAGRQAAFSSGGGAGSMVW